MKCTQVAGGGEGEIFRCLLLIGRAEDKKQNHQEEGRLNRPPHLTVIPPKDPPPESVTPPPPLPQVCLFSNLR